MTKATEFGYFGRLYVPVRGYHDRGLIGYGSLDAGLQPIADGFIKHIKMLLSPIMPGTVVVGIARMNNLKEVGGIGVKSLIYFEIVSTLARVIGRAVTNLIGNGVAMLAAADGMTSPTTTGRR